jgi:hypothetical protein
LSFDFFSNYFEKEQSGWLAWFGMALAFVNKCSWKTEFHHDVHHLVSPLISIEESHHFVNPGVKVILLFCHYFFKFAMILLELPLV